MDLIQKLVVSLAWKKVDFESSRFKSQETQQVQLSASPQ